MLKLYSFNPLWTMNTTVFQETSNLYHISEPIIGRRFQKIILGRSLRSIFIDPFSFAKIKRCNTSQGFGAFFVQSCDRLLFPFFLFLVFFLVLSWFLRQLVIEFWTNSALIRLTSNFKFQRKRNRTAASCRKNTIFFFSVKAYNRSLFWRFAGVSTGYVIKQLVHVLAVPTSSYGCT